MGNGVTRISNCCFAGGGVGDISRRHHDIAVYLMDPLHEGLGHSFCYVRPDPHRLSTSNKIHSEDSSNSTFFRSISGASVSANTSTPPLSASLTDASSHSSGLDRPSAFESSESFASIPLQPVPRGQIQSGSGVLIPGSGPIERGFLSGPIERGFLSGPIDRGLYSGPVEVVDDKEQNFSKLQRSASHNSIIGSADEIESKPRKKQSLMKNLKRVLSNTVSRGVKGRGRRRRRRMGEPGLSERRSENLNGNGSGGGSNGSANLSGQVSFFSNEDGESEMSMQSQNLQWAQGKAGEDRVHIVISEEHGWVFVGIYDGFNGPDAPDYLLANLYTNVHKELKGLLWCERPEPVSKTEETEEVSVSCQKGSSKLRSGDVSNCAKISHKYRSRDAPWRGETDGERLELDWKVQERLKCKRSNCCDGVNHFDVLRALSQALKKTEDDYLQIADKMAPENPELALMGSCVLVMLMKGEDVYLMNVGDSRAVLAQNRRTNLGLGKVNQDLEIISEESMRDLEVFGADEFYRLPSLHSIQLTKDHSTYVEKEVQRIKNEHPDDPSAILNDRVKGYLKVTRAFGVGFLKQPKWNDLLLEMFRIDYIGMSPYINCSPSLYHHRLSQRDRFLILSSDGLYQYFDNEEAVNEVEMFLAAFPEGDPAQHLIEEVLFRAAKKSGMDFHELLDIPPGDRRRYHDDVSVIVISLEGRIWSWRSSV